MLDLGSERTTSRFARVRPAVRPARPGARPLSWRAFRSGLQTIHLWTGLILCIPLILIGLSGSALLVQREILRLNEPAATAEGEYQTIARMVAAAETAVAEEWSANAVTLPSARGKPAAIRFQRGNRNYQVYVDPVSLAVLGSEEVVRRGPIMRFFTDIHEFLMLPPHIGFHLVGWMAVAMTFIGFSGLVLWWPRKGRWREAFGVRRGARGLRLHLDLHNMVGIWGLVVFLILSISGIYLTFPQTVSSAIRTAFPSRPLDLSSPLPNAARDWPLAPEQAIALARSAVPQGRVTGVQLPSERSTHYVVQMDSIGLGPAFPPITVVLDPKNEDFVSVDDPRRYPKADRVLNVLYALHFSVGMGWFWTFLVFLSGLTPLFLAFTGITIWWKKRNLRARLLAQPAPADLRQVEPA